ncbi:hypothetical protein C1H21_13105 [Xanthomonas arboricola pv. juglandis]|nr:hypothetical protein C1H21_13105 [Xanthomonas arboricola pv. juglandis]
MHTDHLDWSLPAHRRRTLSGMDAAPEPTWTYLRRVPRWWAGKGRAANSQRRVRGALTARGTRRASVSGGCVAASRPPGVPQSVRTPHQAIGRWSGKPWVLRDLR